MTSGWKATIAGILVFSCGLPSMGIAEVGDGAFAEGRVFLFEGTETIEIQGVERDEFERDGWTCNGEACKKSVAVEAKCKVDVAHALTNGAVSHWKCSGNGIKAIREISRDAPVLDGIWIRNENGICHVGESRLPRNLLDMTKAVYKWIVSHKRWEYSCPKDELFVVAKGAWAENMATTPCYDNGEPCVRLFFTHAPNRSCLRKTVELEDVVIDEICMDPQGIASAGATFEGGEVRKIALKRIE